MANDSSRQGSDSDAFGDPVNLAAADADGRAPGDPVDQVSGDPVSRASGDPLEQVPGDPVDPAAGDTGDQDAGDPVDQVRQWLAARGTLPGPEAGPSAGDESVSPQPGRGTPGRHEPVRDTSGQDTSGQDTSGQGRSELGRSGRRDQDGDRRGKRGAGSGRQSRDAPGRSAAAGGVDDDPEERARTIVLRQLTGQARTRAELEKKLASKEIPAEASRAVLDRFTEVGLINDAEFARSWVDSRQQRRNLSRVALRQELRRKGVDPEIIADAVDVVETDDEYDAALDLARRKARPMAGLAAEVRKRRLAGALARRGFSSSIVYRVLDEVEDSDRFED